MVEPFPVSKRCPGSGVGCINRETAGLEGDVCRKGNNGIKVGYKGARNKLTGLKAGWTPVLFRISGDAEPVKSHGGFGGGLLRLGTTSLGGGLKWEGRGGGCIDSAKDPNLPRKSVVFPIPEVKPGRIHIARLLLPWVCECEFIWVTPNRIVRALDFVPIEEPAVARSQGH